MDTAFTIISIGLLTALIGGLGVVGVVPLGAVAVQFTVTLTNPVVNCTTTCVASVTAQDTNTTQSYLLVSRVTNAIGQTILNLYTNVPASASSQPVNTNLGSLNSGTYTYCAFATTSGGVSISTTLCTSTFNTGSFSLYMAGTGGLGTVSPLPGTYSYTAGQTVTLTYTGSSGATLQNWLIIGDGATCTSNSPCTPSSNPYILTMNANYQVSANLNTAGSNYYLVQSDITSGTISGTISPSGPQQIFAVGSPGPQSITYTATPAAGWSFQSYSIVGTSFVSNSPTLTLTSAQLATYAPTGTFPPFSLFVTFTAKPVLALTASTGITTSPPPGNSLQSVGAQVTVSETTASGYCFQGWLLQQGSGSVTNLGTGQSVTITIVAGSNSLLASGSPTSTGFCNIKTYGSIPYLSWALFIGGLGLTGYGGLRRKGE